MEGADSVSATPILRFRGWVPTVSGRLSFSVLGRTEYPSRAVYANVADHACRYIAIYQRYDISDAIIPSHFLGITGDFIFLVIGNTIDTDDGSQFELVGECFIFHDHALWNAAILRELSDYQDFLRRYSYLTHQPLSDYANYQQTRILDICRSHASFCANLILPRRGTATISVSVSNITSAAAPRLPADAQRRLSIIHALAAQIYFFVKNLAHHHQHHDPTTDTIIDLSYISNDDVAWRLNTLFSMYRTVIDYKRNPHSSSFNDCIGIIAYARTFVELCKEEVGDEASGKLPNYFGDNTAESIRATQSRIERELLVKQRRQDTIRNTLLAILSIVLSFTGLLQVTTIKIDIQPDPILRLSVEWALTHATSTISAFLLLLLGISLWSRSRYSDRLPRLGILTMRMLQAFRSGYVVLALIAWAILLGVWATFIALR